MGEALDRVARLETVLRADITERLGGLPVCRRLLPNLQLHEFETLLFSDPSAFLEAFPDNQAAIGRLRAIRARFRNPEEINQTPDGSPSRRILDILPDYQKVVDGVLIAQRIGLAAMRRECPHFNGWLDRLFALGDL